MGKGDDPNCRGAQLQPMLICEPGQAAGPERTDSDLLALWRNDSSLAVTARSLPEEEALAAAEERYPPRAILEATLALAAGVPEADFKAANAHQPYAKLAAGADDSLLTRAAQIRDAWERAAAHPPTPLALTDAQAAATVKHFGKGHLTGRLEDYTPKALRRALGFTAAETRALAGLTDDDLRAMAIRSGAVPAYDGAPSHAQLAARWVTVSAAKPRQAAKQFRVALNTRYAILAQLLGVPQDGSRDPAQIRADLAAQHPTAYAGSPLSFHPQMPDDAERNGIAVTYPPEAERVPAEGAVKHASPWDVLYLDKLRSFAARFAGSHLETIRESRFAPQAAVASGVLAQYGAESGSMNLSAAIVDQLRAARAGTAQPVEVAAVADVICHEMIHAMGGGNGSGRGAGMYRADTPPMWRTHEEGTAVLCAEAHRDQLARELGLWDADQPAPDPEHRMYPLERETVNVIAHVAAGRLDRDDLLGGHYGQPGGWDRDAVALLLDAHASQPGVEERLTYLAGGDPAKQELFKRMLDSCEPSGAEITASQRQRLRERLAAILDDA